MVQFFGVDADGDSISITYLFTDADFLLANAGGTATVDTAFAICFARGTAIATPTGERAVEDLAIGDTVLNAQGQAVAVKWIDRQTFHPLFAALNQKLPIRFAVGALGGGLPHRELFVSPDHALFVDGCLVNASALVNGRTITRTTTWNSNVEYFHIETEAHELVLAEGAPTETFVDNISREHFDNYAEYAALYPNAAPMVELDLPRVAFGRQLPEVIRRRLAAVADALQATMAQSA